MRNVTTKGLDLAKNVFQVHGVDADGVAVVRQRLACGRMLKLFAIVGNLLTARLLLGSCKPPLRKIPQIGNPTVA